MISYTALFIPYRRTPDYFRDYALTLLHDRDLVKCSRQNIIEISAFCESLSSDSP